MRTLLLLDRHLDQPAWGHGADDDVLAVPSSACGLRVPLGDAPVLETAEAVAAAADAEGAAALFLEPVGGGELLAATTPGLRLLVDGLPAPPVVRLAVGQRVDLPPGVTLHVSGLAGAVGPLDAELAGDPCPVCRVPLAAGDRAWVCPRCAAALHQQGEEVPAADRLACAGLSNTCPSCQGPVDAAGGLIHDPRRV